MIMIQGFAAFVLASLISVNFNRVNIIHIPMIYCMTQGIWFICVGLWKGIKLKASQYISRGISTVVVAFYLVEFVLFARYYTGEFDELWKKMYHLGLQDAVTYANQARAQDGTCYVGDVLYPKLLAAANYPTDRFVETVTYRDMEAEFLDPVAFEGYHFGDLQSGLAHKGDVILCGAFNEAVNTYFESLGYEQHKFEDYMVYVVQ